MTEKFWKTPQFKALEDEWRERLNAEGFVDIERNEYQLKQVSSYAYRRSYITEELRNAKSEYLSVMQEMLHLEKEFTDESDKIIMEKTADGWTIREISDFLRSLNLRKFNRCTIRYIRRRYENK